jgi:dTDP-glucose 4,6-dehydratase
MKFLVTGGLGFIGSHFVELLLKNSHSVFVVDKLTYAANPLNLNNESKSLINLKVIDIANEISINEYFDAYGPFDCIVNFAAESHVDRSIVSSAPFIDSNFIGLVNLLEITKNGGSKKLIQISTDEVYGSILDGNWNENSILDPRSPYSATKASAEMMCNSYKNTYGLNVVITRCANNYGPKQSVEKLIPKSIFSILSGKPIQIYGKGNNFREWLYVVDHCEVIYRIATKELTDFSVYNISGVGFSNIQIVEKLKSCSDTKVDIEFVPDRLGHDFRYAVNDDRLKKEFNWKPHFDFEESLVSTFDWYRLNPKWITESYERIIS